MRFSLVICFFLGHASVDEPHILAKRSVSAGGREGEGGTGGSPARTPACASKKKMAIERLRLEKSIIIRS